MILQLRDFSKRLLRCLRCTGAWALSIGLLLERAAAVETPARPLPLQIPAPTNNPATPQRIALGRLLFFDPILSESKDVSCATCHNPKYAWTDGRATPIGIGGIGAGPQRRFRAAGSTPVITRNVPTLLNIAFQGATNAMPAIPENAPMLWDARVRSLEHQVSIPLSTAGEMSLQDSKPHSALDRAVQRLVDIPEYEHRFREAFGPLGSKSTSIDPQRLVQAIASFERSLAGSGS